MKGESRQSNDVAPDFPLDYIKQLNNEKMDRNRNKCKG